MATYTEKDDISPKELEEVTGGHTFYNQAMTADEVAANDARISNFTPEEQKKIIRRIDYRLILTLAFMYCVSLMDRNNLGIASIVGMKTDLVLVGSQYNIIVLVFFITYVLLQPPAVVILRKVGPQIFLPGICLAWGIVMIGFGFVRSWVALIPLRLLLGAIESGFFPGCAYLLSCWYPRYELHKRNAVFFAIGSLASAFSGILAYGFSQLSGMGSGDGLGQHVKGTVLHGISGWRWIFILQGVLTAVIAIVGAFLIVDFPEKSAAPFFIKFLTVKEAEFVVARIELDRHDAIAEAFNLRKYLLAGVDLKVWGFATLFGCTTVSLYAIAYFLPIILRDGMGFGIAEAQCLTAPPYVLAAILMYGCAYYGDKYHIRGPFVIFCAICGLIGLPLLGFVENIGVRYFGAFLATMAGNAAVPCIMTWQANNIRGQWKRALCSATLVGTGGIGGIIGSTVFRSQDSPGFRPGIITCMLANGIMAVTSVALMWKFHRANKRAESGGKVIEGLHGFRYTL